MGSLLEPHGALALPSVYSRIAVRPTEKLRVDGLGLGGFGGSVTVIRVVYGLGPGGSGV